MSRLVIIPTPSDTLASREGTQASGTVTQVSKMGPNVQGTPG